MIFYIKNAFLALIFFVFLTSTLFAEESKIELNYKTDFSTDIITESVYQRPYSFTKNNVEFKLLKADTYTMIGACFVGVGILYLLPESFTNWDKSDSTNIFKKWRKNVKEGPVKDSDDFFLNYITHPYWGAVYYLSARSAGANAFYSFGYSVILSTFFWEYGVEAFAEVPSKQDLIITPVIGSIFGEMFYLSKRHIVNNNYELLGSRIFGRTAIFLMDPITEVSKLFLKERKKENKNLALFSYPTISRAGGFGYNVAINYKF